MRIRTRQAPHIPLTKIHRDINRAIIRFGSAKVPRETMAAAWDCELRDVDPLISDYANDNGLLVNINEKTAIFYRDPNNEK